MDFKIKTKAIRDTPENKAKRKAYLQSKTLMKINKQYPCKVCDEIFGLNVQLKNHMENHRL